MLCEKCKKEFNPENFDEMFFHCFNDYKPFEATGIKGQLIIDSFDGNYRFLSNFCGGPIIYDGLKYNTVEAAFQAQKTLDKNKRLEFTLFTAPQAKRAGRQVKLREDWNQVKDQIMEDLVRIKFNIPKYKQLLLDTGDARLVEGNWWNDTYWGVCNEVGQNKLGKILMKIREEVRNS